MILDTSKLYKPQDAVKHAFQAAFGAEHMLLDVQKARAYFFEEYMLFHKPAPLIERISADMVRVNLAAWKEANLPPMWLFDLFVMSATAPSENGDADFQKYMAQIEKLAAKGELPFSYKEWEEYVEEYRKRGTPYAVHHSSDYRQKEKPAYRIISSPQCKLVPILYCLSGKKSAVIGIDGRTGSGKSEMAELLAKLFKTKPISMDDFFLPAELRTEERLGSTGGNIHYERFMEEVIPNLRSNLDFSYRPFDCRQMDFVCKKTIPASSFMVVEGAYSHHPHFGNYLDTRVFSTIDPATQMERVKKRNGEEAAEFFMEKWIPMEERYFKEFDIEKKADLVV